MSRSIDKDNDVCMYIKPKRHFFFQIQILQILAQNVRVIADGTQTFLQIIK